METLHGRDSAARRHFNGSEREDRLPEAPHGDDIARPALTKEELQNLLFDQIGLSKRECREMVNAIFEEMRVALEAGEIVKLEGFGRFQPKQRPKPGRATFAAGSGLPCLSAASSPSIRREN